MPQPRRDIELILDPAFVSQIDAIPTSELRSRIARANAEEDDLSYQRRLLHAQQDLVKAEITQREQGGGRDADVVTQLRKVLSDVAAGGSRGARGRLGNSGSSPGRRGPEILAADGFLARLQDVSDDELSERTTMLEHEERPLSERRRALHAVIDALQSELVARYKRGDADPLELLGNTGQSGGT